MFMIDYLVVMRTTVGTLHKVSVDILETNLMAFTIDGLDHTYVRIKSMLQMQNNMSFDEFLPLLLSE